MEQEERLRLSLLARELKISHESADTILIDHFGMINTDG